MKKLSIPSLAAGAFLTASAAVAWGIQQNNTTEQQNAINESIAQNQAKLSIHPTDEINYNQDGSLKKYRYECSKDGKSAHITLRDNKSGSDQLTLVFTTLDTRPAEPVMDTKTRPGTELSTTIMDAATFCGARHLQ